MHECLYCGDINQSIPAEQSMHLLACSIAIDGKSSESVQCAMLKACDACTDMGQLY